MKMTLSDWQKAELPALRSSSFVESKISDVTAVAYYFRTIDRMDVDFWRTEFAFLKTFETQGIMPATLVVNNSTPLIQEFCDRYGIKVQTAANLVPGDIKTLALDLVRNLHGRFDTDYVLTIQDDGFPMRSGLDEFIGKYDYVGAPWVRHVTPYDWWPRGYRVGNGGFSLRSKRICQAAGEYYRKWFSRLPYWWFLMGDDVFYCRTLRFLFPALRRRFSWAPPEAASRFAVECCCDFLREGERPLGFHGECGFARWQDGQGK